MKYGADHPSFQKMESALNHKEKPGLVSSGDISVGISHLFCDHGKVIFSLKAPAMLVMQGSLSKKGELDDDYQFYAGPRFICGY